MLVLDILRYTPKLVWGILVVLCVLGYLQSRPRTRPLAAIAIVPIVLLGVSVAGVVNAFGPSPLAFVGWVVGLGLAVVLNETLILAPGVRHDAAARRFAIPGAGDRSS